MAIWEIATVMHTTVIIDYGSGNLHSAHKALERAVGESGAEQRIVVSCDVAEVLAADRIVLPGVGAFGDCRAGLENVPGLVEAITQVVRNKERPYLGICVGMQLMADKGLEFGVHEGFSWIPGDVKAIAPNDPALKIPHMGWNTIDVVWDHPLLEGISTGDDGLHAYFVHSYHFVPTHRRDVVAETDYGGPLTAMVGRDNMVGTQFHPEKSQGLGLKLLANFLRWQP